MTYSNALYSTQILLNLDYEDQPKYLNLHVINLPSKEGAKFTLSVHTTNEEHARAIFAILQPTLTNTCILFKEGSQTQFAKNFSEKSFLIQPKRSSTNLEDTIDEIKTAIQSNFPSQLTPIQRYNQLLTAIHRAPTALIAAESEASHKYPRL